MKNRVPPPVYLLLFGAIMWLVARSPFALSIELPYAKQAAWLVAFPGFALIAAAMFGFGRAGTTVDPLHPDAASVLVTSGLYRFTRNPMYLGLLLILTGWGLGLQSLSNIPVIAVFTVVLTYFQIKPEEAALTERFGDDYRDYCRTVRRWL